LETCCTRVVCLLILRTVYHFFQSPDITTVNINYYSIFNSNKVQNGFESIVNFSGSILTISVQWACQLKIGIPPRLCIPLSFKLMSSRTQVDQECISRSFFHISSINNLSFNSPVHMEIQHRSRPNHHLVTLTGIAVRPHGWKDLDV
jgi:hypothetical protein